MVASWKPDSSRELNVSFVPNENENPIVDQEDVLEEGGEELPAGAYQLLPPDMAQGLNDDDQSSGFSSDDDSSDEGQGHMHPIPEEPEDLAAKMEGVTGWEKEDIKVNCDEIKELMKNFTLPQSSIPDWAVAVPESSLSQFITTKMNKPIASSSKESK